MKEVELALMHHLFVTKGWRLKEGDMQIHALDVEHNLLPSVQSIEIFIKD